MINVLLNGKIERKSKIDCYDNSFNFFFLKKKKKKKKKKLYSKEKEIE